MYVFEVASRRAHRINCYEKGLWKTQRKITVRNRLKSRCQGRLHYRADYITVLSLDFDGKREIKCISTIPGMVAIFNERQDTVNKYLVRSLQKKFCTWQGIEI